MENTDTLQKPRKKVIQPRTERQLEVLEKARKAKADKKNIKKSSATVTASDYVAEKDVSEAEVSDVESEPEIIVHKKKSTSKKPTKKKIVYISESESESESEYEEEVVRIPKGGFYNSSSDAEEIIIRKPIRKQSIIKKLKTVTQKTKPIKREPEYEYSECQQAEMPTPRQRGLSPDGSDASRTASVRRNYYEPEAPRMMPYTVPSWDSL